MSFFPFRQSLLTLTHRLRKFVSWFGGIERAVLFSLSLLAISSWSFAWISGAVLQGNTQALDEWIVLQMRSANDHSVPIGPLWFQELGRDATAFGGIAWLTTATFAVAGFLALSRKTHLASYLILSTLSGLILAIVLKDVYSRPRPALVPHLSYVYTSSFPSGHSMLSALVYLNLGSLIAAAVKRPLLKLYVMSIAVGLSVVVGLSRVYLGVHYPTDVVAGWIIGLFWALTSSLIAKRFQVFNST